MVLSLVEYNLRVTKCNHQWEKVIAFTKTEFKKMPNHYRKFGMPPYVNYSYSGSSDNSHSLHLLTISGTY
jgi:hypothetical protein